jgi:integrase
MTSRAPWVEKLPRNPRTGEFGAKARVPALNRSKVFRAATWNEARSEALRWIDDTVSGRKRTSAEMTLGEYRAKYALIVEWAPDTRRNNDWLWAHLIAPRFADDPLSAIQRVPIRDWIADLKRDGVSDDRRHQSLVHLRAMLNSAKADGELEAGMPITKGFAPKPPARVGHALRPEQATLLAAEIGLRYGAVVLLGVTTGLRIGELLGLKPGDIDDRQMVLHMRRGVRGGAMGKASISIGPGKTTAAKRDVPINQAQLRLVREHLDQFGSSPEGYIFTNTLGGWLVYQTFRQVFVRTVKRIRKSAPDFPPIKIHDLRKTTGRYLLDNRDLNPKDVARMMGHADVAMTYQVYSPLIPGDKSLPSHQAAMAKRFELPGADEAETAIQPWTAPTTPRFVTPIKLCPQCGREFVPVHRRKVTCSPACFHLRRNEQARVRSQRARDRRTEPDLGLAALGVIGPTSSGRNGVPVLAVVETWAAPIRTARWGG